MGNRQTLMIQYRLTSKRSTSKINSWHEAFVSLVFQGNLKQTICIAKRSTVRIMHMYIYDIIKPLSHHGQWNRDVEKPAIISENDEVDKDKWYWWF